MMDLLIEREAFLRAIFDAPDDDTPRLVYADFLEENGDPDRASFIRLECELARGDASEMQQRQLEEQLGALKQRCLAERLQKPGAEEGTTSWPWREEKTRRGFPVLQGVASVDAGMLGDGRKLRLEVVDSRPELFSARALKANPGPQPLSGDGIETLLALPFMEQILELDLSGRVTTNDEPSKEVPLDWDREFVPRLVDMWVNPAISASGVNVLVQCRWSRRLLALDLQHNNLDNDAARAIVKSPYLGNLKRLDLLAGNRFRGRVWQQVIERFGEEVVG